MATEMKLKAGRTYKTKANLEKAIKDANFPPEYKYFVYRDDEGRWSALFSGVIASGLNHFYVMDKGFIIVS